MIERITIDGFRNIESAEMDLARVNIVTGPNRGGKTSVAAAIEFALTGRPAFVNDAGAGLEHLVRRGARKASVSVKAGHVDGVRTIPAKDSAALDQQLASLVGSRAMAQACLRARHLLTLPSNQQQSLLYPVLGVDLSDGAYLAAIDRHVAGLADFMRPHLAAARKAKGGPEAYAREQRRQVNAARKQARTDIDALERSMPPAVEPVDEAALSAELRKVLDAIATLTAAGRAATADFDRAIAAWKQAREASERADAEVAGAERELAEAEAKLADGLAKWGSVTPDDVRAAEQARTEAREGRNRAREDHARLVDALIERADTVACPAWTDFRQSLLDLSDLEMAAEQCPARSRLLERTHDLTRLLAMAEKALEAAEKAADDAEESCYQADYRCGLLRTYRSRVESLTEVLCEVRQRRDRLGALPEIPANPVDAPDPALAPLFARLAEIEAAQADARKASQSAAVRAAHLRQVEGMRERLSSQEHDATRWDRLCTLLAPRGVQADLAVTPVADFAASVDAVCREWFSLAFRIVNQPEKGLWQCECWNVLDGDPPDSGPWVPLGAGFASGNETVLCCAVLQVELASRVGFPLVLLDELGLDAEWRPALIEYLLEAPVQSVLVQPANDRDEEGRLVRPRLSVPGLSIFWAESGTITCLADGRDAGSPEPDRQAAA